MVTKTARAPRAGRPAQRQDRPAQRQGQTAGFSFIEMVLVLLVLGILFAIAVPRYQAQILKAKEAVLEHNLATLRSGSTSTGPTTTSFRRTSRTSSSRGTSGESPKTP